MNQAAVLPVLTARRVAKSPPIHPAAMLHWLRYVHGDRLGYLEIFALDMAGGPLTRFFRWPLERATAARYAASLAASHEVWSGALLKEEPRRGAELPGRMAWCDADTGKLRPAADDEIAELGPAVVLSGSPGNRQVWLALDTIATPDQIRQINKRLIARIGGDPKHSPDSVMRIPGTLNHKQCTTRKHQCRPVELLQRHKRRASLAEMAPDSSPVHEEPFELPDPAPVPRKIPKDVRDAMEGRQEDRSVHTYDVAYQAARLGFTDGQIRSLLESDLITQARIADKKRQQSGWWPGELGRVLARVRTEHPSTSRNLADLIGSLRTHADMPDAGHVYSALAAAVSSEYLEGEPMWLMLVGPASSGKTDAINLIAGDYAMDTITEASLLSWSLPPEKGAPPVPAGILARIGNDESGLITIADLSTLLSADARNSKQDVLSALRRIYDGSYARSVAAPGGLQPTTGLEWHGQVTIVSACTSAIDRYVAMANALGPRWLYCRLPERDFASRQRMADKSWSPNSRELRASERAMAASVILDAGARVDEIQLTDGLVSIINEAAQVCCAGRSHVARHAYGPRRIAGTPETEEPARVIKQLGKMARSLLAMELDESYVRQLVRRCAVDSMPRVRIKVLCALATATSPVSTYGLSQAIRTDRRLVREQLEELEAIGMVAGWRDGDDKDAPEAEEQIDRRTVHWELSGHDGILARSVIHAALDAGYSA